ncbi:MAG: hypothetical protein ACLQMH_07860 [Solirubrobacteraceae bacterium]
MDERVPRPPEVPLRPDSSEPQLVPLGDYSMMVGLFTAHYTDEDAEDKPDDLVSRYGVGVMSDHGALG